MTRAPRQSRTGDTPQDSPPSPSLPLDGRLRRRRDLGVILFGVLGRLDLTTQQLGELNRLALAASARRTLHGDDHLAFLDGDQVLHGLTSEGSDDDLDFAARQD